MDQSLKIMPIVFHQKKEDGSQVAVWHIEESESQLASMIPLTGELEVQLNGFSCTNRRLEWLASRVLISLLAQCQPNVEYSHTGQPFIRGLGHRISISHTRGFAAVCLSTRALAGIDIEYPSPRISRLENRFVNPLENAFIPDTEKRVYHGLIWCAKETLYKMAATPGLIFKEDLLVKPFAANQQGHIPAIFFLNKEVKEFQLLYKVVPEYYLVWHY